MLALVLVLVLVLLVTTVRWRSSRFSQQQLSLLSWQPQES
jgi:hypothetical protein